MTPDEQVNILLVDDQPGNLLALEAVLQDLGQNLIQVRSGEEALKKLLEMDFAVVLMDVQMPGMDGLETAGLIRQRRSSQHTPIIFLTAFEPNHVQIFKGYSMGAVDYLFKPIVPEVLRSKVAVFVELCRKTDEVKRQSQQLRESERKAHERRMDEERQQWELDRLRAEAEKDKRIAETLRQKNEELARLNQEVQEANQRKDEFLAMLAHELRNPLAPILNGLYLMRLNDADPAAVESARDMIERQIRLMTRLVDDLLDISRITRGQIQLRKEPVELTTIVARAVESTRPLIHARGHHLELTSLPQPVWLDADPTRLEQVLANLLNNAAKYTEPGGRIRLTASCESDMVVLSVQDSGVGIAPEVLPHVFDLFVQADRSLARSQGGLGIGLTLVRTLIEMHGGTVQALSAGLGQGSEFVIRLPVTVASENSPRSASSDPSGVNQPGNLRILVVDDNRDAAESLALLLRLEGHAVCVTYDGPSAVAAAASYRPEVILLDIGLPGMDGYEVARQVRNDEELSRTLLIAMTGYGQDEDRRRTQQAGFDEHLIKPVDPEQVQRLLAAASCNHHS